MLHISKSALFVGAALALAACGDSSSAQDKTTEVPETAQSPEDVEAIVRAYLLDNPEIILEALDVLEEREAAEISTALSSDSRDPSIGPEDAPITIVEYFDYRCTYCKISVDWVMEQARESDGKIRVVFKELPILSPDSRTAAIAALAAQKQGKYIEFHQELMKYPSQLNEEAIEKLAENVGLNVTRLQRDMESPALLSHIQDINDEARKYGADATPSFFVNGELIQGFNRPALEARIAALSEGL